MKIKASANLSAGGRSVYLIKTTNLSVLMYRIYQWPLKHMHIVSNLSLIRSSLSVVFPAFLIASVSSLHKRHYPIQLRIILPFSSVPDNGKLVTTLSSYLGKQSSDAEGT